LGSVELALLDGVITEVKVAQEHQVLEVVDFPHIPHAVLREIEAAKGD
jgi:hypothetical protein